MSNSVIRAMERNSAKHIESKQETKPRRKNNKPEQKTNKDLRKYFELNDWSMNRIESKGIYSKSQERYTASETDTYVSDFMGSTPNGLCGCVESKAKSKRHTLSEGQRDFLINKINHGAFAVCVDSVDCLVDIVDKFKNCAIDDRKKLLLDHLPKSKIKNDDGPLSD